MNGSHLKVQALIISLLHLVLFSARGDGVLLLRPYAWDSQVSEVIPFERSRPKESSGYRAYYIDKRGKEFSVEKKLIVEEIDLPVPTSYPNITNSSEANTLMEKKLGLEKISTKVPQAAQYLRPAAAALAAELGRFQAGDRKLNGRWMSGGDYANQQKRIEEERVAQTRAAEENFRVQQEARITAEKRATEERAAAETKQRKLEDDTRQKMADALATFSASQQDALPSFQSAGKGTLTGQVFVATRGGSNIKLGVVQVRVYTRAGVDSLVNALKKYATTMVRLKRRARDEEKRRYEAAQTSERAAFDAYLQNSLDEGRRQYEAAQAAVKAAGDIYFPFEVEAKYYLSGSFFDEAMGDSLAIAETDADGKFVLSLPREGEFVLVAHSMRLVGGESEQYYWIQPVSLHGENTGVQNLSNTNLTSAIGTSSLVHTTH